MEVECRKLEGEGRFISLLTRALKIHASTFGFLHSVKERAWKARLHVRGCGLSGKVGMSLLCWSLVSG